MVLPPDMPAIETEDLALLIAAFEDNPMQITQATTSDGIAGHPVVFPKHMLGAFAQLSGDHGAAMILRAHKDDIIHVALKDNRARLDLDTPEAWNAWRASHL